MTYGLYSRATIRTIGLAHVLPSQLMKILNDVNELVQQCLIEQSGLFEDLAMYVYAKPIGTLPGETIEIGVNERLPYFDAVWTVAGIAPQYLSFQLDDLL
jgi:hypothetical protein